MGSFIISLGGSLIIPGHIDVEYLKAFRELILRHIKTPLTNTFFLVCGGGKTARIYQDAARKVVSVPDEDLDWLGIHSTRLNAHLLRTIFRDVAHPAIITNPTERESITEPVTIGAGWKPGWSTDYVAVKIAQQYGVKTIINLTNTDYVYDEDPKKNGNAKPFEKLSWAEYCPMVGDTWTPGLNAPFDPIASKVAREIGLRVIIANGKNLENLERIFLENLAASSTFVGTVIS